MRFLQLCFLLLAVLNLAAQPKNIVIHASGNPCEPSIAINPTNTNNIVAGAVLDHAYHSFDGGKTWKIQKLSSPFGVWGDPAITFDTKGNAYYFHLSNPPKGTWIDRIVCQKSTDGGVKWSEGTYMGMNNQKAQDKHWPAVDPRTDHIYVTWTQFDKYGSEDKNDESNIMFSVSEDKGLTWRTPIDINQYAGDCVDSDTTVEGAVPAVGPNGEVYVCWGAADKLFFDRSTDGGRTWLDKDIIASTQPGGWDYKIPGIYRCNGMPITFCDLSNGPNRGRIYICWSDQRNGEDDTDVFIIHSDDKGNTWSTPKRVNDDKSKRHQFMCWATIDQTNGQIWSIWYDRRNTTETLTEVYMANSTDGGANFTNFLVSESPFLPNPNTFFGDYTNVSAHNGMVRPIWARLHDNKLSILTALIEPDKLTTYAHTSSATTPMVENVGNTAAFEIRKKGTYRVELWNVTTGQSVFSIMPLTKKDKGRYVMNFSAPNNIKASDEFAVRVLNRKGKVVYTRKWTKQ